MELSGDFGRYLSSLEPDEDAVAAAKAAHEKVRERLKDDEETKDAHKDTFLSGSYARHTAIHDINDVDVICIVDIDHTITEPEVVLSWLKGVLSKYYKETRLQGRSIGASAAKGVWLDIVPVHADVGRRRPAVDSRPGCEGMGANASEGPDRRGDQQEQGDGRLLRANGQIAEVVARSAADRKVKAKVVYS